MSWFLKNPCIAVILTGGNQLYGNNLGRDFSNHLCEQPEVVDLSSEADPALLNEEKCFFYYRQRGELSGFLTTLTNSTHTKEEKFLIYKQWHFLSVSPAPH